MDSFAFFDVSICDKIISIAIECTGYICNICGSMDLKVEYKNSKCRLCSNSFMGCGFIKYCMVSAIKCNNCGKYEKKNQYIR